MLIITAVLALLLSLLIAEKLLLSKSVNSIENRIHVNGTRGKSTVTEYIAAAIYSPGEDTMAKITGVIPTIIHNGKRKEIKRYGSARVQEQFDTIRYARKNRCKNLVLECMSVNPELQRVESRFFHPQIYIICNIRDDHREIMGQDIQSQTDAICSAIPANCTVISTKSDQFEEIKKAAESKNCRVIEADHSLVQESEYDFKSIFSENLAIALTTCQLLDIDLSTAKDNLNRYIDQARSKLSTLSAERGISILHGFDVNDTESASIFLNKHLEDLDAEQEIVIIFNTRADRPLRTDLFAEWIAVLPEIRMVIVTGSHRKRAQYSLHKHGVDPKIVLDLPSRRTKEIKSILLERCNNNTLAITIGNIANEGRTIENELR